MTLALLETTVTMQCTLAFGEGPDRSLGSETSSNSSSNFCRFAIFPSLKMLWAKKHGRQGLKCMTSCSCIRISTLSALFQILVNKLLTPHLVICQKGMHFSYPVKCMAVQSQSAILSTDQSFSKNEFGYMLPTAVPLVTVNVLRCLQMFDARVEVSLPLQYVLLSCHSNSHYHN